MLDVVRWIIAIPLGAISVLCSLANGILLLGSLLAAKKENHPFSLFLPGLGPVFGTLFFLIVPIDGAAQLWWIALVADPLSVLILPGVVVFIARHSMRELPPTLRGPKRSRKRH